jgi:hypothetical protein
MEQLKTVNVTTEEEQPVPMDVTSGEALSEGLGTNVAPKVVMGNQGTLLNVQDLEAPRTPPSPPSGSAQAPRTALSWLGEDQPSAKRSRIIKMTYAGNKTHEYDPDSPNPEIPCPKCHEITSILSFVCNQCGFHMFKPPPEATARERKLQLGLVQQYRPNTRSARSDAGRLKQTMKSHRKYANKTNPATGEPFKSIQDRFENDVLYRYRMLSQGWSIDMLGPLQSLLEENILTHKSHRTKAQIEQATTWYHTHPELGDGQTSAGNPDWNQTKVYRGQLQQNLAKVQSGQPVAPQFASLLQERFGMDVLVEETEAGDGEAQPSATAGEGPGTGTQSAWWSYTPSASTWDSTWYSGDASSSSAAAAPAWSSDEWPAPAAAPKKQYYPKPPTTKPPTNWWEDKKW